MCPGWPDDPDTVAEAFAEPEVFADKTVGPLADHYTDVIAKLDKRPVVIGHSFGVPLTFEQFRYAFARQQKRNTGVTES